MTDTRWWKYVQELIAGDTAQDAAARAGFDKSAFTRWKKGANADAAFALKLARGYHANVLEALVAAGLITDDEAGLKRVEVGKVDVLRGISDLELAEEHLRRARIAAAAHDRDEATDQGGAVIAGDFRSRFGGRFAEDAAAHEGTSIYDEQNESGD